MQPLSIETRNPRHRVKLLPKFYKRQFLKHVDSKMKLVIGVLCLLFVVFPIVFGFVLTSLNDDGGAKLRFRSHSVTDSQNDIDKEDWNLDYKYPLVECGTTVGIIRIQLNRDWAPKGVDRLVALIEDGFYDDTPFFRAVNNFLVQFGESSYLDRKRKWSTRIDDDPQLDPPIPFTDGIVSYAGFDTNSRTNQIFFSLGHNKGLGKQHWEVPIGQVTSDTLSIAHAVYTGYGDDVLKAIGPFRRSIQQLPDEEKQEQLYQFFKEKYPNLDWIETCSIVKGGVERLGFGSV